MDAATATRFAYNIQRSFSSR